MTTDTVCDMIEMNGGCKGAGPAVLCAPFTLVARISCRTPDLVAGLAVEETMVTGFSVNGGGTCQTDGGVGLEFESLHGHELNVTGWMTLLG